MLKHGLAFFPVCHLLLGEGGSNYILGQTLATVFGPTLDLDLIVDVEAGVFQGRSFSTYSLLKLMSFHSALIIMGLPLSPT